MMKLRPQASSAHRSIMKATLVTYPSCIASTPAMAATSRTQGMTARRECSRMDAAREQAIRPDEENRKQEDEAEGIAIAAGDVARSEGLGDSQQHAARKRSPDRAHSGEDDDDERFQRDMRPHRRLHREGEAE